MGEVRTQIEAHFHSGDNVDLSQLIFYIQQHRNFILFQLPPLSKQISLDSIQNYGAVYVLAIQGDESTRKCYVTNEVMLPDFACSF